MLRAKTGSLRLLVIVLGILALAGISCARAAEPTATPRPAAAPVATAAPQPAATAVPAPTRAPIPTSAPTLVRPTEWTVILSDDPAEGDPFTEYGSNNQGMVSTHVFDQLIWLRDPQGGNNIQPQPHLAESWEFPDDKTAVFHLRKGVMLHNGEELTAEHAKYGFDGVIATDPAIRAKGGLAPLGEAVVVDKYTVQFNMPAVYSPVINAISGLRMPALVRKNTTGEVFGKKPVGAGPYKVVQWERDKPVILESYDGYWRGKKAFPPRLIFRFIQEPSTRIAEILAGRAQISQRVPIGELSRLEKDAKAEVVALKNYARLLYNINLYVTDPPIRDARVRQAVAYSINRDIIVQGILEGRGTPAPSGFLLPGELGWTPDMKPYPYDPAKAKELLAQAGIPNGFTFNWTITQGVFQKDFEIAEAAANMMAQVGIKANLQSVERARLLKNRNEGEYHILELTWPWSWDRDSFFNFTMVLGQNDKLMIPRWGPTPEVITKIRQMWQEQRATLDTAKRAEIFGRLNKYAAEEVAYLSIHTNDEVWGIQKTTSWRHHGLGSATENGIYYDFYEMFGLTPPK